MPHARQRTAALPEPDLARIWAAAELERTKVGEYLAAVAAVLEAARNGEMSPDDRRLLALTAAGLRQAGAGLHAYADQAALHGFASAADEVMCADADAEGFKRGVAVASRGRHRARQSRRPGAGQLTLIPGEGRQAAFGAALAGITVIPHSLKAVLAGLGAAVVTVTASHPVTLPDVTRTPVAHVVVAAEEYTDPAPGVDGPPEGGNGWLAAGGR